MYISPVLAKKGTLMIIKLYNENPNPREINQVVSVLRDGGIVIYPTDTLYGMGCDALNVRAVERICDLKGINPQKSNLSIICNDMSVISEYAKVNTPTFKLMKRNLPGPLPLSYPLPLHFPRFTRTRRRWASAFPTTTSSGKSWHNLATRC